MEIIKEETLWYRFKNGDNDALSLLYNQHIHQLFSYGMRIRGDDQLVKDCIQEVFVHLIDKKKKLTITEVTSAYLFKSLRNKLFEELRTKTLRSDNVKHISTNEIVFDESMEQITIKSEEEISRRRILEAALGSLSNYQREAIFLKYSQDFSYDKIAEILDIDVASARTLIYRSLKKVKEAILPNIGKEIGAKSLLLYLSLLK